MKTLLCLSLLVLVAPVLPAQAGPPIPLYLPLIARGETPLSQIEGLAYSYYNWRVNAGPDAEVYTLRADGSQLRRLTDNDLQDERPLWSPDRTFIAWTQTSSGQERREEAWLMNADGSNAHRIGDLTHLAPTAWSPVENRLLVRLYEPLAPAGQNRVLYVTAPGAALTPIATEAWAGAWSPRGDYISFYKDAPDYTHDLYLARPDGSDATLLASGADNLENWSPNGQWIAYQKKVDGSLDVYIARPDGSETRPVATSALPEYQAGWVEGGAGLLIRRVLETANYTSALDLYSLATGTTVPFVPGDPPKWRSVVGISPDGRSVVYQEGLGSWVLKLAALAGGPTSTISPALNGSLSFGGWSGDGRRIAWSEHIAYTPGSGRSHLYVATVAGPALTYQLLDTEAGVPDWLPDSSWLSASTGYYGTGLRMHNPASGARFDLPASADNTQLIITEWRTTR